jgi:hypothetical protein
MIETQQIAVRIVKIGFAPQPRPIGRRTVELDTAPLQPCVHCVQVSAFKIDDHSRYDRRGHLIQ